MARSGHIPEQDAPWYPLYRALVDPQPRVEAGRRIGQHSLAHAMCDVSDGFAADLRSLLVPEGLGARIEAHALPVSGPLQSYCEARGLSAETYALSGGEDYELMFTADPADEPHIVEVLTATATPVVRVGEVTAAPDIEVYSSDGTVTELPGGFEHYTPGGPS